MDHMVDYFSTYLYQKRGFYYFSRRVPKELHHCHTKHHIVLALIFETVFVVTHLECLL